MNPATWAGFAYCRRRLLRPEDQDGALAIGLVPDAPVLAVGQDDRGDQFRLHQGRVDEDLAGGAAVGVDESGVEALEGALQIAILARGDGEVAFCGGNGHGLLLGLRVHLDR